jgi:hypothetical protein
LVTTYILGCISLVYEEQDVRLLLSTDLLPTLKRISHDVKVWEYKPEPRTLPSKSHLHSQQLLSSCFLSDGQNNVKIPLDADKESRPDFMLSLQIYPLPENGVLATSDSWRTLVVKGYEKNDKDRCRSPAVQYNVEDRSVVRCYVTFLSDALGFVRINSLQLECNATQFLRGISPQMDPHFVCSTKLQIVSICKW